ncbi:UNVERIFIED_CONTAM: hypothetical protein Sangu_2031600 [Sesamum angustifolium]|uniref:Uncharacterized protein n=1 Tax=Sesamum angustifolium TaxID=2727405 RepID=A0AAW2LHY0_9LAMI
MGTLGTSLLEVRPILEEVPYVVLRYLPLTLHLQRLYSSRATAEHVTWHATPQIEKGSMCHPSNAEAWKHFDRMYPDFAKESLNVRLGFCTYVDQSVVCKIKARTVVDDSKWTGTVAHQPEEVVPVPIVAIDIKSYHLRDPNGLLVVLEAAGTSRR